MKDPFYHQIVEALAGHLDPTLFEQCVADLLRSDFPSLVPILGGNDAGMDAAIADGQGPAMPVVVTTAADVIGNLRRNLRRYVEAGGTRDKAVLITSQSLTPKRRRNLEGAAQGLGFTLLQTYDRDALAARLYGDSRWCRDLLGLSGKPSALSRVAESSRPHFDLPLIGRDGERGWLDNSSGDRVVVGDPGSGKTFLVHQLVQEGKALYAVEDDRGRLANALRESRPPVVVVDDAHVRLERLKRLRHLRDDVGFDFELLATTWKGDEAKVVAELEHLEDNQVLHLELLPRDDIVEIFKACGVTAADAYLRELVDQAANRPGLAVTLAQLWHQQRYELLFQGKALQDETLRAVEELLGGERPVALLACFALGGDRGVSMTRVGEFLGMSLADVHAKTVNLAAAGIVSEVDSKTLAIWPRQLRIALLGSVFFDASATALNWRELFPHVASRPAAVETLAIAVVRDINVPREDLERLLVEIDSKRAWQIYVQRGESEALWGLDHYRGERSDLLLPALRTDAMSVIDRVLDEATSREPTPGESRSPALEALRSWAEDAEAAKQFGNVLLNRRHRLVRCALARLRRCADSWSALEALRIALSPGLEGSAPDPGMGRTIRLSFGVLDASSLRALYELWSEVRAVLADAVAFDPEPLIRLAEDTVEPKPAATAEKIEGTREVRWQFARTVLQDVAALPWLTVGPAARVRRLAEQIGLDLPLDPDPEFELLFPPHPDMKDFTAWERERVGEVQELAARLSNQAPSTVVVTVATLKQEAAKIGQTWPDFTYEFAKDLAQRVADPIHWLHELQQSDIPVDSLLSLLPFLDRAVREARSGWQEALSRALDDKRSVRAAVWQVLQHPDPGEKLLVRALVVAPSMADSVVETMCLRGEVPDGTLLLLLEHADDDVAIHAAVGEWLAKPRGEVRKSVRPAWRKAILRARTCEFGGQLSRPSVDYWLREILGSNRELAEAWLRRRIESESKALEWLIDEDHVVVHAVRALTEKQRRQLLEDLQPGPALHLMSRLLVGRDPDLYAKLLARPELADAHFSPLQWGPPDEEWVMLANAALTAGKSAEDVALAAYHGGHMMSAPFSGHWRRWETAFGNLTSSKSPAMREVSVRGAEIARESVEREEERERSEALRGWQSF